MTKGMAQRLHRENVSKVLKKQEMRKRCGGT